MIIDLLFKRKYLVVVILLSLAVLLLLLGFYGIFSQDNKPGVVEESSSKPDWVTYTSNKYDFEISFPADWKINEDTTDQNSPKINIYKPGYRNNLPMDNFSPETNVSVFPKGIPTDAVVGKTVDVSFALDEEVSKSYDYLLASGEAWASYISFKNHPKSWEPWGFIWINTELHDVEYFCKSADDSKPINECNTFEGDIIERRGDIDSDLRNTQIQILRTFKFI